MTTATTTSAESIVLTAARVDTAVRDLEPILPGWCIIPLHEGVPVAKWSTITRQTLEEREALARRRHDAWAVLTEPSHLFVIDLDRHVDGVDGVANYADCIAPTKAPPVRVRTPRDGWHLYHQPPANAQSVQAILPGVDCKGRGGMATFVGPGRWLVIKDWSFPPVPAPFAGLLAEHHAERARRAVEALEAAERGIGQSWTDRRLNGLVGTVARAEEGTRNAVLHWAACRGREAIGAGLTEDAVADALIAAGVIAGLPVTEARRTVCRTLRGAR